MGILRKGIVNDVDHAGWTCKVHTYDGREFHAVDINNLRPYVEPITNTAPGCVLCLERFKPNQWITRIHTCNHVYHDSCTKKSIAVKAHLFSCPNCRGSGPREPVRFNFINGHACCSICDRQLHEDMRLFVDRRNSAVICVFCMFAINTRGRIAFDESFIDFVDIRDEEDEEDTEDIEDSEDIEVHGIED